MGIFDKLTGEFIDIIEWLDETQDTMVFRFDRHGNEIKNGAQLTVRESQVAVLVDEGQIADVFPPGRYELETANMPILTTLRGWKHGFESPFKVEVYFVNTKRFTDQKWGTKNPIMMRDDDFGVVRVRAFGTYSMRVEDAPVFLKEVVGTNWEFTTEDINDQCRSFVVSGFTDALGEQKIPVLDLAASYDEMGAFLTDKIKPKFGEHGLDLLNLVVENVSVPAEVEQAIDERSKMGAVGDLGKYTQFKAAESLEKAAENPGGMGGIGAQMAAGMTMGQAMTGSQQQAPITPPPIPQQTVYYMAVNGEQAGPYDLNTLAAKVSSGELIRETLVWTKGMTEWSKAGDVPEVSALFGSVPPPIPPAE
jgi:membrane protease subunit (stomatin/prohibitin family)